MGYTNFNKIITYDINEMESILTENEDRFILKSMLLLKSTDVEIFKYINDNFMFLDSDSGEFINIFFIHKTSLLIPNTITTNNFNLQTCTSNLNAQYFDEINIKIAEKLGVNTLDLPKLILYDNYPDPEHLFELPLALDENSRNNPDNYYQDIFLNLFSLIKKKCDDYTSIDDLTENEKSKIVKSIFNSLKNKNKIKEIKKVSNNIKWFLDLALSLKP